jgi:hypothetical protein
MSTLWVYLRFQLMMFVFGIVGPIFLFGYFASQPDPTLRWMYWWGLLITAADVLIALAITDSVVSSKHRAEHPADGAQGSPPTETDRRVGNGVTVGRPPTTGQGQR